MPIINQVVAGGGITPTGTISITSNGTHDVTDYATADVNVPTTAPAHYIEYDVDNGMLKHSTTTSQIINMTGVTSVDEYGLIKAYYNNRNISDVDFSNIKSLESNAMDKCFYNSSITSLDLSGLGPELNGSAALQSVCGYCSSLTRVDFSNIEGTVAGNAFNVAFMHCSSLTNVSFPKLKIVYGNSAMSGICYEDTGLTNAEFPELIVMDGSSNSTMFYRCTSLTNLGFPKLTKVGNQATFASAFQRTAITVMRFPKLTTIIPNGFCSSAFSECTNLTDLYFNSLIKSSKLTTSTFSNDMLRSCSGVTVHFPSNLETVMSGWSVVTNGFGGTNTTVLFDLPAITSLDLTYVVGDLTFTQGAPFENIANGSDIVSVDASALVRCTTNNAFRNAFTGSTSLVSANFGELTVIGNNPGFSGQNFQYAFDGCTALTDINFSKLVNLNIASEAASDSYSNMEYMCRGCTALTTMRFDSLRAIGSAGMKNAFVNCTALTDIYFPALLTFSRTGTFANMLSGVTGCTVHFPANLSTIGTITVGGTNSIVVFDLPSTFILTGANATEFERNPKYDTATALAWRVRDTGKNTSLVVDWTPFYTNGMTDPTVGTTIYSDAACTQSVTTIASIA